MPLSEAAEAFLRARTLGFHLPRPGARPSPRAHSTTRLGPVEVVDALTRMDLPAKGMRGVERCVSRRRVALVDFEDRSPVLLKWPDDEAELHNNFESVALTMLERLDLPVRMTQCVPSVLGSHDDGKMLALDVLDPAISLRSQLGLTPDLSSPLLLELAVCLATLHASDITSLRADFPEWDLMLPVPTSCQLTVEEYVLGCGMDFDAYLITMQRLEPTFQRLHEAWSPSSLIHFDLRDDNILFAVDTSPPLCRLIDWELAGFGDPLYDVGYAAAHLLLPMVRAQAGRDVSRDFARACSHNVRRFIDYYAAVRALPRPSHERIVEYVGLTLIVHASMRLQQMGALGRVGHVCLLMGERLLLSPLTSGLLPVPVGSRTATPGTWTEGKAC